MEKVTISEISEIAKPGKTTFWSCKCPNGSKYTVWLDKIAILIKNNLNIECEAEVCQSGNFWNIRAFKPSNITPTPEKITTTKPLASIKDNSIVSQCLVKCAAEIISKGAYPSGNKLGQDLNEVMNELVGAYKTGVRLLEQ